MLSSFLVFFGPGTPSQLVVAIFITLLAIKVMSYYEPYKDKSDDRFAEAGQWLLFTVFFAGLLLQVDVTGNTPDDQARLSGILIFLSALPASYILFTATSELLTMVRSEGCGSTFALSKLRSGATFCCKSHLSPPEDDFRQRTISDAVELQTGLDGDERSRATSAATEFINPIYKDQAPTAPAEAKSAEDSSKRRAAVFSKAAASKSNPERQTRRSTISTVSNTSAMSNFDDL